MGAAAAALRTIWRDYRFKSETFTGKYIGIDIDDEMLEWCRRNFDAGRFEFHRSTQASKVYGSGEGASSYYVAANGR